MPGSGCARARKFLWERASDRAGERMKGGKEVGSKEEVVSERETDGGRDRVEMEGWRWEAAFSCPPHHPRPAPAHAPRCLHRPRPTQTNRAILPPPPRRCSNQAAAPFQGGVARSDAIARRQIPAAAAAAAAARLLLERHDVDVGWQRRTQRRPARRLPVSTRGARGARKGEGGGAEFRAPLQLQQQQLLLPAAAATPAAAAAARAPAGLAVHKAAGGGPARPLGPGVGPADGGG